MLNMRVASQVGLHNLRIRVDGSGIPFGNLLTVVQNHEPMRNVHDHFHHVFYNKDGDSLLVDLFDKVDLIHQFRRIEPGAGFVQEEKLRLCRQCPGDLESAAFTTLGAIALQGVRLADAKLGEIVAVIGLGLVGQLAVQVLKAAGCLVAGVDIRAERAELARQLGADAVSTDPEAFVAACGELSAGQGADAVLIAADTESDEPVELAGEVARAAGAAEK